MCWESPNRSNGSKSLMTVLFPERKLKSETLLIEVLLDSLVSLFCWEATIKYSVSSRVAANLSSTALHNLKKTKRE